MCEFMFFLTYTWHSLLCLLLSYSVCACTHIRACGIHARIIGSGKKPAYALQTSCSLASRVHTVEAATRALFRTDEQLIATYQARGEHAESLSLRHCSREIWLNISVFSMEYTGLWHVGGKAIRIKPWLYIRIHFTAETIILYGLMRSFCIHFIFMALWIEFHKIVNRSIHGKEMIEKESVFIIKIPHIPWEGKWIFRDSF